jgi:hypothetical protein
MKPALAIFCLILASAGALSVDGQVMSKVVVGGRKAAAAGTWYYPSISTFPTSSGAQPANYLWATPVTVTGGSHITQIGLEIFTDNGGAVKLSLGTYSGSTWTPIASSGCTIATPTGTGWVVCSGLSISISPPVTYWVGFDFASANNVFYYSTATATGNVCNNPETYSTFPAASGCSLSNNFTVAVRIWAQ